jgi:hypothetical protein
MVLKKKIMKTLLSAILVLIVSITANAQTVKPNGSAKPSEEKQIVADNHLKRSIQQKQLSAAPERIADSSSQATVRKDVKKKKRKCGTKPTSKV